jgi:hypothetical protein
VRLAAQDHGFIEGDGRQAVDAGGGGRGDLLRLDQVVQLVEPDERHLRGYVIRRLRGVPGSQGHEQGDHRQEPCDVSQLHRQGPSLMHIDCIVSLRRTLAYLARQISDPLPILRMLHHDASTSV